LACCAAAAALAQELPEILETVEVRVVNVDVVVTDAEGRPVSGLEREMFELQVNGRPAPLDYFSEVVDGSTVGSTTEEGGATEEGSSIEEERSVALPYLAIVYDGRGLSPGRARRAVETLSDRLDGLLARTRAVMVLRQGQSLVVEQPMTSDREQLAAALGRLTVARSAPLDPGIRQMLLLQLENTRPPRAPRETDEDMAAMQEGIARVAGQEIAELLLRQIRAQAGQERFAAEESIRQLRSVVGSLAGLPGRKAILLLGRGQQQRPADALFRLWWRKFSRFGPSVGVFSIESEIGQVRGDRMLAELVDDATAHRVTFYSHDPAGLRAVGSSAENSSPQANLEIAQETEGALDSLVDLSLATGGVSRVRASGVEPLLDEMLNGFGSYYSLGFTPDEIERGRVRVRLRQPGLRVRYLKQFASRTAAQELEAATLATLLAEVEDNRLQVGVEFGEAERQKDGTFLVPMLIRVPMAHLTLLPRGAYHVGRLSFVVIAQGADGDLSRPATGEVPIEIANAELLSAVGSTAGYRLRLQMRGGEHVVAIGVRDEVAGQDATLRLALAPDDRGRRQHASRR
jgi:VWFA-related protein